MRKRRRRRRKREREPWHATNVTCCCTSLSRSRADFICSQRWERTDSCSCRSPPAADAAAAAVSWDHRTPTTTTTSLLKAQKWKKKRSSLLSRAASSCRNCSYLYVLLQTYACPPPSSSSSSFLPFIFLIGLLPRRRYQDSHRHLSLYATITTFLFFSGYAPVFSYTARWLRYYDAGAYFFFFFLRSCDVTTLDFDLFKGPNGRSPYNGFVFWLGWLRSKYRTFVKVSRWRSSQQPTPSVFSFHLNVLFSSSRIKYRWPKYVSFLTPNCFRLISSKQKIFLNKMTALQVHRV